MVTALALSTEPLQVKITQPYLRQVGESAKRQNCGQASCCHALENNTPICTSVRQAACDCALPASEARYSGKITHVARTACVSMESAVVNTAAIASAHRAASIAVKCGSLLVLHPLLACVMLHPHDYLVLLASIPPEGGGHAEATDQERQLPRVHCKPAQQD